MITHTIELSTLECYECGMPIGLSTKWVETAQAVGKYKKKFWCPYCGASQGWGTSQHKKKIQELQRQRDLFSERLGKESRKRREAEGEAEHFRRSRDGMKGALTKAKKRIGNGTCPCCSRHFKNVEAHMKNKHPEYCSEEVK